MKLIIALLMLVGACCAQVTVQCPALPCDIHVLPPPTPPVCPAPGVLVNNVCTCPSPNTLINGVCTVPVPTGKFTIGQRVQVTQSTTGGVYVRSTSSSTSTVLGIAAVGAKGTIVAGPVTDTTGDKQTRWSVNYDSGPDGWSIETRLEASAPVVALKWNPSTTTGVNYNLYRGMLSGGPYVKKTQTPVSGTQYVDSTVTGGEGYTYYYVATSVTTSGKESVYSAEVKALVP